MDPAAADQALFADTLYNDLVLPLRLDTQPPALSSGSEMRLRAIALVEDSRNEDSEERGEHAAALQRMEAKLDLVLALCAGVLAQQRQPLLPLPVRWSARGVRVDWPASAGPLPAVCGITLQAADWLPDPIQLPVQVLATEASAGGSRIWLGFTPLSDALQAALERHVFRLHRRQIASNRRQR
jgi:hypothetical protein